MTPSPTDYPQIERGGPDDFPQAQSPLTPLREAQASVREGLARERGTELSRED
jgi:hypothetical protein